MRLYRSLLIDDVQKNIEVKDLYFRKLGKTDLNVGVIGLGTEFLWHEPKDTIVSVVHEALDNGVNYYDLWMPNPEIRDYFGDAIKGRREKINIAGMMLNPQFN